MAGGGVRMPSTPSTWGGSPRAAYHALVDVQTLLPLAGAVAVASFDRKISDWATAHTPIYGSHNAAGDAHTTLQIPLQVESVFTALATPSGDDPEEWAYTKAKGIGIEWLSQRATANATTFIKREAGRTHPMAVIPRACLQAPRRVPSTMRPLPTGILTTSRCCPTR
jgi:hypothetical protein